MDKGFKKTGVDKWEKNENGFNIDACAELKSIDNIQSSGESYEVYLLTTDTAFSNLSAEILKECIPEIFKNIKVNDIIPVKGLQIYDYEKFSKVGLYNLFNEINKIIKDKGNENAILNVSGGYKAVIPYLTIYGQLYDIPVKYIYEDSSELITISKLPIQFDWRFAEKYFSYLDNPSNISNKDYIRELETYHLIHYVKINRRYERTIIGNMIRDYIFNNLPESKKVMGYFMEYKLLDYYINNPYGSYTKVKHSVRENWLKGRELDLVMSDNDNNFVVGEVKSSYQLTNAENNNERLFDKVSRQISEQVRLMKNAGKIPDEYHLYVYSTDKNFYPYAEILRNVKAIKSLVEENGIKFIAYKIFIKYTNDSLVNGKKYNDKNPYKGFMAMPLEKGDITNF